MILQSSTESTTRVPSRTRTTDDKQVSVVRQSPSSTVSPSDKPVNKTDMMKKKVMVNNGQVKLVNIDRNAYYDQINQIYDRYMSNRDESNRSTHDGNQVMINQLVHDEMKIEDEHVFNDEEKVVVTNNQVNDDVVVTDTSREEIFIDGHNTLSDEDINYNNNKSDVNDDNQVINIISFSSLSMEDETNKIDRATSIEKHVAESMCLPMEINGVILPRPVLIDQGASRSVMRKSAFDSFTEQTSQKPRVYRVKNMYVISSSGEIVPVIGKFLARLTTPRASNEQSILVHRGTVIYIVQDTQEKDIICDLVIGRSTLATSHYSCIDMKGTGSLVSSHRDDKGTTRESGSVHARRWPRERYR